MSLITRCPACSTQFKVVRDQLRISDGWVRCGRCSEVFDASLDLRDSSDVTVPVPPDALDSTVPATPSATPTQPGVEPAGQDEPTADAPAPAGSVDQHALLEPADLDLLAPLLKSAPAVLSPPAEAMKWPARDLLVWSPTPQASALQVKSPSALTPAGDLPPFGLIADEPWPVQPSAPPDAAASEAVADLAEAASHHAPIAALVPPPVDAERIELTSPSFDAPVEEAAVDSQLQKALRRARAKADKIARSREKKASLAIARAGGPAIVAESVLPEAQSSVLSFLEDDVPVSSRSRRTFRPRTLRWVAILAALLLIVQVMRQERDVLAARQPGLRPMLALLCNLTGCEVSALRQIGSITIDGAAFARDKEPNTYRLSFALRNSVAMPLAMPAVELTLLDTQERAVVRRVILPAEFGAPSELAANGERMASLSLTLNAAEAATLPPVAGYRVLAFYP